MCPDLEKLRSDVALLAGMQRYFREACATIGYLKDAWAQYSLAKNGPFYPGGKNGVIGVCKVLQTG